MRHMLGLLAALAAAPGALAQEAPLGVHVQYPAAGAVITATDSTFVFGRLEAPEPAAARLTVNGHPVPVHPGGGWLAFVPVEPDSFTFRIRAEAGGARAEADHTVWVPRPATAPGDPALGYKPATIEPAGLLELYAGDTLRASVIAAPGQEVFARLSGRLTPLAPTAPPPTSAARAAFGRVEAAGVAGEPAGAGAWWRYRGDVYVTLSGAARDTLALVFRRPDEPDRVVPAALVVFLDPTVVRTAIVDDDTAGTGRTDRRVLARAGPAGAFDVFVPNGTPVAIGRLIRNRREIVLGAGKSAWAETAEMTPAAAPRPRSLVRVVRTRVAPGWSEVVVPLSERLPVDVEQSLDPARYRVTLYGATSDIDIVRLVSDDPLIRAVRWNQPRNGELTLDVDLAGDRAWGWKVAWEGTDLVVSFRHPPPGLADRRFRSPLHGVTVVVDPGHNPDTGAVGPTGFAEKDANLAIALELERILERRGARVVMTRATPDSALGLYERPNLAVAAGGEVFVSIHNNALPDGVNPFENHGTSVLFYHPQSQALAASIQSELLPRTGLPDYGVWHDNLVMTRMSEMPAVLVEAAFMMIPEQEALLRTREYQRRIAEGVAAGIERFLRGRAR